MCSRSLRALSNGIPQPTNSFVDMWWDATRADILLESAFGLPHLWCLGHAKGAVHVLGDGTEPGCRVGNLVGHHHDALEVRTHVRSLALGEGVKPCRTAIHNVSREVRPRSHQGGCGIGRPLPTVEAVLVEQVPPVGLLLAIRHPLEMTEIQSK